MQTNPEPAFGALLRRYREAAGLSQEDLAERAELTAAAIGALERGVRRRPFPHTVQLLAAALGLDEAARAALIGAVPRRGTAPPEGQPPAVDAEQTRPDALPGPSSDGRLDFPQPPQPATRHGAAAFVGRAAELAVLHNRLEEALAGRGSLVMLIGEAGIGKTRLAREFADSAASRGALVLWSCCFEGDWHPPYGPWAEALGAFVRDGAARSLLRELGVGAGPIARLVPEVYAALPEVPLPSPLSPDEERFRLYDAIVRFFFAVSRQQPVVLVIDDLHWADPDSLLLLRYLARFVARARMLVLGAYRDPEFGLNEAHPLMDTLSGLRREGSYERIVVRGFSREEVAEYLARASGQSLPQALVGVIEEETSGNPFYACEVFRHLTEEAKLLQRGGRWTTDLSIRELGIPEGVRQVVGRRVARLSEGTGGLLKMASGFTSGFGFDVLQILTELPEQELLNCIDEALQAGLIRASGQAPPRYEFAHAIVRHTLYDGLNPDRKARLHRRIAFALESTLTGEAAGDVAELVAQYHASAMLPGAARGIPYALRAAERARAVYAHEKVISFLRMARDLGTESPAAERADILCQLAVAEADAIRLGDARRTADDALDAMRAAGVAPRAEAEFLSVVARALKDDGADPTAWEPLVERGLALMGETRDLLWARLALLRDHFQSIQSGPIGGGQWQGSDAEAVAIARSQGGEEDYARTLEPLDWRTRRESEEVLALARTWSRPVAIMRALDVGGRDLLYRHGAFREALAVYEELLAVSERFGSISGQGEALHQIVTSQLATGDLVRVQETIRRGEEIVARLGAAHRLRLATTGAQIALTYFLEGDWAPLIEAAAGYATGAHAGHSSVGAVAAAFAALALERAGNDTAARRLLGHVTAVAQQTSPRTYAHSLTVDLVATAVFDLQATDYAATCQHLALDVLRCGVGDSPFGSLELCVARMSALLGDLHGAQEYFERARGRLDAQGRSHVRAILDYDEARMLIWADATNRAKIGELLDAALGGFQAHGMLGWAQRVAEQKHALTACAGADARSDGRYPAGLTAREAQVLRLIAAGLTNKEVAAELVLSVPTVERHVANIYGKIGAGRRYEAIAFAQSHGLGSDVALTGS